MKFLLKLFRALNSAQSPWQLTVPVILGMIAGLTPLSGLQNVVILFLAFLLNIHLGLFFVSAALFAGVGYLFDPWFEQLGYALLGSDGLQGLWSSWYGSGLMRLTHFNNTLVMGATAVSLLLAVPLWLLLGWLIRRYRVELGAFLESHPLFGTFGILKATEKKSPLLRWWGAALFLLAGGAVAAIALLLVDPLLKWGIEKGGSAALQREVRVGAVDTNLFKGVVAIKRLEIAGAKEGIDAMSADIIRFDAALAPLLIDKISIDRIEVGGVGFDTPATLKKAHAPQKDAASGEAKGFELPAFSFPDPKSLIEKADLESVKAYEEARAEIDAIKTRWEKTAKTDLDPQALSDLKADLEKIRTMSKSKDPQQLLKLAAEVKAFKEKVDARKKTIGKLKADFDADKQRIAALTEKVKTAPQRDFARLKTAYTLDGSGVQNVIGMLFGEKVKHYLALARKYYALVSPYIQSENPPKEAVPPRGEGRWMRFALLHPSPDLHIGLTQIDGTFRSQAFRAEITDISDEQKALGRPITFTAASDGPVVAGLEIKGEDNRLGKLVVDRVNFKADRLPTGAVAMAPVMIDKASLAFSGDLTVSDASALKGAGSFTFSDTALRVEGLGGKEGEIVADILSGINRFRIDTRAGGTLLAPTVEATSDLDRQIAKGIGSAMGKELAQYQNTLKSQLDAQTASRLESLAGSEKGIADIGALVGDQKALLGELSKEATEAMGAPGGGLKGILPF